MALENPLAAAQSFIFGPGTANPSLEDLKRRRAVALAMAARQRAFPKTAGEGMTYLGEAIGDRIADERLSAAEQAYRARGAAASAGAAAPFVGAPTAPPPAGARSDVVDPTATRDNIAAVLTSTAPGVPSANPTSSEADAPPGGGLSGEWAARANAIGGIESSSNRDPYRAIGAVTPKGDRAFGKYQVMGVNIPEWTEAAIGQPLTPKQFLASEAAQDAVFKHRFGSYVDKYGEEGAARAWYAGERGMKNLNATDQHGRLTVGGYGQDYLSRLRGQQRGAPTSALHPSGSMSDGPPIGVPTGSPILADENPETPTDITRAPTMLAQASGMGKIPGAFDPRVPEPAAPPSGLRAADPAANRPIVKPVAPLKDERPTQLEINGYRLMREFPGDEDKQREGQTLMAYGKAQRDAAYARRVEEFNKEFGAYEKAVESERLYARELPAKQFELEERRQKQAREEQDRTDFPLGLDKHHAIVKDSYEQVKNVPRAQAAIDNVKQLLASDPGMFTGSGANIKMSLAKWSQALGRPFDPAVSNTETFRGLITPIIAALRPAIVGPGSQSQPEFKLLQDAAAGNITLERRSIENILSTIEKQGVLDAVNHQRTLIANAGTSPRGENLRQVWSSSYPLPMERLVPRDIVAKLREEVTKNPDKAAAEIEEFNRTYYTPGLAERLLGR